MIELRRDAVVRATRSLVVVIALAAALMSALLATATGASAAKLEGPKWVKPGKAVTFRALGVGPNSSIRADKPQARKVVRTKGGRRKKGKLRSCGSLVFTPHSGDALARIKARGIGCRAARRKLTAWRRNSYRPVKGPRGYRCDWGPQGPRPAARVHCRRIGASLPVISYTSGT